MATVSYRLRGQWILPRVNLGAVARWALVTGIAALHVASLMHLPAPFVDETWRASRAWGLIQTGLNFGALDAGVFDRYDGYWTFFPLTEIWFTALAIRVFGLSLLTTRLASLAFGIILLGEIYAIARRLSGASASFWAPVLLSLSAPFLLSAHLGRQDIMVAAFGYGGLLLTLLSSKRRVVTAIYSGLAGFVAAIAVEIHPNGIVFIPALLALYALEHGKGTLRTFRFYSCLAGLFAGILAYVSIHVLPHPATYVALTRLGYSASHTPPVLVLDPNVWIESLVDLCSFYVLPGGLVLALLAVTFMGPSRVNRRLLVVFIVLVLSMLGAIRNKQIYYAILIAPASCLLIADYLGSLSWSRWQTSRHCRLQLIPTIPLLVAFITSFPALYGPQGIADYDKVGRTLAQTVPSSSSLIGSGTYWFYLTEHKYLSWEQLIYHRRRVPGSTLEDAFRALRPEYLILDTQMNHFIVRDKRQVGGYVGALAIEEAELSAFLKRYGRLVTSGSTDSFGEFRLYHLAGY